MGLYNQKGWEVWQCPKDVLSFDTTVKLLGGKYVGSLGPRTTDSFGPDYKSAYLLIGAVNGDAAFEKYCPSDMATAPAHDGASAPDCGSPLNGGWMPNVSATLPACST